MGLRSWARSVARILTRRPRQAETDNKTAEKNETDEKDEQPVERISYSPAEQSPPKLTMRISSDWTQWSSDTKDLLGDPRAIAKPPERTSPRNSIAKTSVSQTPPTSTSPPVSSVEPKEQAKQLPGTVGVKAVRDIVYYLGRAFDPCPFVVAGLSAMTYYGFEERGDTQVAIMCPQECTGAIRQWAPAKLGVSNGGSSPTVFGMRIKDGGELYYIRIGYCTNFDALHSIRVGAWGTPILSVPALANMAAMAYVGSEGQKKAAHAADLRWLVNKSIELGRQNPFQRMTRERVPGIVNKAFWDTYTASFPDTISLFEKAGLGRNRCSPCFSVARVFT